MDDLRNRIGTFVLTNALINDRIQNVQTMLANTVVLIAERQINMTRYVAVHPDFNIVGEGERPGEYEYICHRADNGVVTGHWRRVKAA